VSSLRERPERLDPAPGVPTQSPAFDVVVIGASAGGLVALAKLLGDLPGSFPVALALVLHLRADRPSVLTDVLARYTPLSVLWAEDRGHLCRGTLTVAPPDRHLRVRAGGVLSLDDSPLVHYSRPSVDALFISAASAFGARTLAVILTGNGRDGADGALAVHRADGVVLAQDEASSEFFSMPREAIGLGGVTHVLPLESIAPALRRLVTLGADAALAGWPPPPAARRPT